MMALWAVVGMVAAAWAEAVQVVAAKVMAKRGSVAEGWESLVVVGTALVAWVASWAVVVGCKVDLLGCAEAGEAPERWVEAMLAAEMVVPVAEAPAGEAMVAVVQVAVVMEAAAAVVVAVVAQLVEWVAP